MPIHLEAPQRNCSGPDGLGWNRLRVEVYLGDQCALQPRSFESLKYESWNTVFAKWGDFGRCFREGQCRGCELMEPASLDIAGDKALVRIDEQNTPRIVDSSEDGWNGAGQEVRWSFLARLEGWTLGERYQDEHSAGFWLHRAL